MSLLALDASGPHAGLALLDDTGAPLGRWTTPLKPGLIETLPLLLQEAITGQTITDLAVCIGPGSFTGLRTSIALAQGVAAGLGCTLWGISAWAAYQEALPNLSHPLWVALRARRGRLFLLRDGIAEAWADEAIPQPSSPIIAAGEEATLLTTYLRARGTEVVQSKAVLIDPLWVGHAALRQKQAGQAPLPALPLYVDPPEAKLPAAGLRPAPL